MNKVALHIFFIVVAVVGCHSAPPPYSVVEVNGKSYTGGLVWIKSSSDTTTLIKLGFNHLIGPYPGDASLYYVAWWPAKIKASKSKAIWDLKPLGLEKQGDSVVATKSPRRSRLSPPPEDYPTVMIKGREYVGARLLVMSASDTLLLKPYGFQGFIGQGSVSGGFSYLALVPKEMSWDYLPSQLLDIWYDPIAKPSWGEPSVYMKPPQYWPDEPLNHAPKDCYVYTVEAREYYKGRLMVEEATDTVLLKPFGFRDFQRVYATRTTGAEYVSLWPKELPWNKLPSKLHQLWYQCDKPPSAR